MMVKASGSLIEASCMPRIWESELLEIEIMTELVAEVLRNVPNEVTSFRTAVRIQTRISMVSGL
jgi:hypothetical protein